MTSTAPAGWHRRLSGIVARVRSGSTVAETEILRQMTDVFKELAHISVDLGALWIAVGEVKTKLDGLNGKLEGVSDQHVELRDKLVELSALANGKLDNHEKALAELAGSVVEQIDASNESSELLGRLLQSTRARLEVLEEARQTPA